jgi:hypothetical protein
VNWEAIGAIGEIVGASAVVLSLVYLAIQIRNQNIESRSAAVHQVLESNKSFISQLQDPGLAEIWLLGIEDFDSLTDVQRLRFVIYLTVALRSFEDAFFQWRSGRLDDDTWHTLTAVIKDVKSTAAFGKFLEMRRHHFRPEFATYLGELEPGDYSYIKKEGL